MPLQPAPVAAPPALPRRLWEVLTHPLLLIPLLGLALLALLAHQYLPQLPNTMVGDLSARSEWLNHTASTLPLGDLALAFGVLDLAHNLPLIALLALLLAALLLRIADQLLLALATRELLPPGMALPTTRAVDLQEGGGTGSWRDQLQRFCQRRQHIPVTGSAPQIWYGDRNQRHTWWVALLYLGLLLILLALVFNLRTGWQLDDITLAPGQRISLAPYSSDTLVLDADAQTLQLCCRPRRSVSLQAGGFSTLGFRLHLRQLGPNLRLQALSDAGPLPLQAIEQSGAPQPHLTLNFPETRSELSVAIPKRNLLIRIILTDPRHFLVQALNAGADTPFFAQTIDGPATLALDGIRLQLQPSVTLSASSRPWNWLLIPGFLLALLGAYLRWRYPYYRLGLRAGAGGQALRWQGQCGAHPTLAEWQQMAQNAGADKP